MVGVRLEVDAMIITGMITSLRNLYRCVERAGIAIEGTVLNSLANAEVALTRDEKELGVVMLDIGGGTTEIAVFQQGHLKNIAVLPVGGDHITNDIAVGLRTTLVTAEKIKLEHGAASIKAIGEQATIELPQISGKEARKVPAQDLVLIIEARLAEILHMAHEELLHLGYQEPLPAGVVLTGGVSLMPGIAELAEQIFQTTARVAQLAMWVKSPIYSTAVGIIHYAQHTICTRKGVSWPQKCHT